MSLNTEQQRKRGVFRQNNFLNDPNVTKQLAPPSASHSVTMTDCIYRGITLQPRLNLSPDALIFDNSKGTFPLQFFKAENVSIAAVEPVTDKAAGSANKMNHPQIISSLLHVSAHNISLVEVSASNIKFEQKRDDGSPIKLRISNSTQKNPKRSTVRLQSCKFENI